MDATITIVPFVGRERELGRLLGRLDRAAAGQGGVVLIAGEPGIGKTRTVEEFTTAARARGGQVLWGRCLEGKGAPAFWPWIEILRLSAEPKPDPEPHLADYGGRDRDDPRRTRGGNTGRRPHAGRRLAIDACSRRGSENRVIRAGPRGRSRQMTGVCGRSD